MRKVILLLLVLLTAGNVVYSQNEDIIPIIVKEQTTQGTRGNHAPAKVQVECFYYPFANSLELSFLSNLGTVTVSLENLNTGEMKEYVGTSSTGVMMIPVVPNYAYRMNIVTESGRDYIAQFFAGENDSDS